MGVDARHTATVYGRSLWAHFRSVVEYPADFWVMATTGIFWQIMSFGFVTILFQNVNAVGGWGYHEMLMLVGFLAVAAGSPALYWDGIWSIADQVADGGMDYRITRPAPVMPQIATLHIGLQGVGEVPLGAAMFVYGWIGAGVGLGQIPVALLLFACAAVIQVAMYTIANSANFWVKGRVPVFGFFLVEMQNEAMRFPLPVFPMAVRVLLTFAIPLAFASFVPVEILNGRASEWWLLGPPLTAALLAALAVWIFRAGLRSYDSAGH
ncbi:ABC transporter permease [Glycomyces salinus]|uniref:ABC transporter permease n=1 Tax=Glycomyces salinus TaxID=980294 RepID=UPI0018EB9BFE|nr:ABC-2 family transporter protein [Glycomyces salinus]